MMTPAMYNHGAMVVAHGRRSLWAVSEIAVCGYHHSTDTGHKGRFCIEEA